MKKYVIAIAMMLTLGMNAEAASQKHRHTPRTEQTDASKDNQDAIEAFSDTTATDSTDSADEERYVTYRSIGNEDKEFAKDILNDIVSGPAMMALMVPVIAIVGSIIMIPLLLFIIFYFVNKNRRERYKLAQMAIQNGQPIPEEFLKEKATGEKNDYNSGLRQMFTGIGLAIFLGIAAGDIGFGIGALVFFIGLGKWFIARQSRQQDDFFNHMNRNSQNNSNIQDYE